MITLPKVEDFSTKSRALMERIVASVFGEQPLALLKHSFSGWYLATGHLRAESQAYESWRRRVMYQRRHMRAAATAWGERYGYF